MAPALLLHCDNISSCAHHASREVTGENLAFAQLVKVTQELPEPVCMHYKTLTLLWMQGGSTGSTCCMHAAELCSSHKCQHSLRAACGSLPPS